MTLQEFMRSRSLDDEAMASKLGNISAHGVRKWRTGERTPRGHQMQRIFDATEGNVRPDDFFNVSAPAPSEKSAA